MGTPFKLLPFKNHGFLYLSRLVFFPNDYGGTILWNEREFAIQAVIIYIKVEFVVEVDPYNDFEIVAYQHISRGVYIL